MHRKLTPLISLAIICIGILGIAFNVQKVKANETIYIQADGTINPPTAPIQRNGNIYTLTDNITTNTEGIVIKKNNITLNGIGYTLQGSGNGEGISLSYKQNVTIKNINIRQFSIGIDLFKSSNNTITRNNITNSHDGIYLYDSSNILISKNNITKNKAKGIWLDSSSQNTITENNVANNGYGIKFYQSSNNFIYHNNFSNNTLQVHDTSWDCPACTPSINTWDDDASKGNYWSDYTTKYPNASEIDDTGIWNTPYEIDTNNTDSHPLVIPEFPPLIITLFFIILTLTTVMICRRKHVT